MYIVYLPLDGAVAQTILHFKRSPICITSIKSWYTRSLSICKIITGSALPAIFSANAVSKLATSVSLLSIKYFRSFVTAKFTGFLLLSIGLLAFELGKLTFMAFGL